jgi:hypothetical protein
MYAKIEPVSKQQIGKHTTTRVLLETVFFIPSVQSGYKEISVQNSQSSSGVPSEQLVENWVPHGRWQSKMIANKWQERN